jgi:hypothetical protein
MSEPDKSKRIVGVALVLGVAPRATCLALEGFMAVACHWQLVTRGRRPEDIFDTNNDNKVRKTPSWPRSWAKVAALYSCFCIGMRGSTCIIWANLTPFSLKGLGPGYFVLGYAAILALGPGRLLPRRLLSRFPNTARP